MNISKTVFEKLGVIKAYLYTHPKIVKLGFLLVILCMSDIALADDPSGGVIPKPSTDDDPTTGSNDLLDIFVNLVRKKGGPLLIYGGFIFFLFLSGNELYRGYKKYQETDDFGKFKTSLIIGAIFLVLAGGLFYMGGIVLSKWTAAG